jgi:hypothetical protein
MKTSRWLLSLCGVMMLACVGCAAGEVLAVAKPLAPGAVTKTQPILVKAFAIEGAAFLGDNADKPEIVAKQKERIRRELTDYLVERLLANKYNARRYDPKDVTADAVVIDGSFTKVNHGSGAARAWWGMGAGAAYIIADVKVYKAQAPSDVLSQFTVAGTSSGRGGWSAAGDFTSTNLRDLAAETVEYLNKSQR